MNPRQTQNANAEWMNDPRGQAATRGGQRGALYLSVSFTNLLLDKRVRTQARGIGGANGNARLEGARRA